MFTVCLCNFPSQEHGIETISAYTGNSPKWSSNQTGTSAKMLFDLATLEPKDIFKKIYVRFFRADERGDFNTYLAANGSGSSFAEQRHRKFGRCYTLHPEPNILPLGIYYVNMEL